MNILIILFVLFAFLQGCSKIEDPQPSLRKKVAKIVSPSDHPTAGGTLDSETADACVSDEAVPIPNSRTTNPVVPHAPNADGKPVHVSHEHGGKPIAPTQRGTRGLETTTVHPNAPLGAVHGEGDSAAADSGSSIPDRQFPNQSNQALGNDSTTSTPRPNQSRRPRHVDPHVDEDMTRGNPNGVVGTTTPTPGCLTQFVQGLGSCCMGALDFGLRNLQR